MFEQILFKLGQRHEKRHLATFPDVADLTGTPDRTVSEIRKGTPAIYQGELRSPARINGKEIEVIGWQSGKVREELQEFVNNRKI